MSRIKIKVTTKGVGDGGRAPKRTTFKVTTKGTGNRCAVCDSVRYTVQQGIRIIKRGGCFNK